MAKEPKIKIDESKPPVCGIIMPISQIDNCTAEHWLDVRSIIEEVVKSINFRPNLVSNADEIGIIHKRIIHNLYSNEIVVCDVSCKNPNVMFELGIRLAFDKPTVIIKDDLTEYNFDTGVIEHLTYPRDLRFNKIIEFKEFLKNKIISTYSKSISDPNYSTFVKHFGEYKVAKLEETEVSENKFILQVLKDLDDKIDAINKREITKQNNNTITPFPQNIQWSKSFLDNLKNHMLMSNLTLPDSRKEVFDLVKDRYNLPYSQINDILWQLENEHKN